MADLKTTKHRDRSPSSDGRAVAPDETEVDRLGRTRPEAFSNTIQEVGFVTSVLVTNILSVSIFRFLVADRGSFSPYLSYPQDFEKRRGENTDCLGILDQRFQRTPTGSSQRNRHRT